MRTIFRNLILTISLAAFSCGCTDNPDEEVNSYEKLLLGTWTQVEPTAPETLNYSFSSTKAGSFFVTDRTGAVVSSQTFYWSADENYISLKNFNQQSRVEYKLNETILTLGSGNEAIAYKKK